MAQWQPMTQDEKEKWKYREQCLKAGAIEPAFIDDPANPTGPKILNPNRGKPTGLPFPEPQLEPEDDYDYDPVEGVFTTEAGFQRWARMIYHEYGVKPVGYVEEAEPAGVSK